MSVKAKPNHFASQLGTKEITRSNGRAYSIRDNKGRLFFPDEWYNFYKALDKTKGYTYSKQEVTFNTLINTGARIMEIQNIKVKDIDFNRDNVVLRVLKRIINRPGLQNKGASKIRVISISRKFKRFLAKVVKEYKLGAEDYLPILKTSPANVALKKHLERIGVQDWKMFSLNNIRKTAENWFHTMDIKTFKINKHFGHDRDIYDKEYLNHEVFTIEEKEWIRSFYDDLAQKMV